jgi:hypothetical protein
MVCLEQAEAASKELEKNAFLEIAEQYGLAFEASAIAAMARRPRRAANAVR